MTTIIIARFDLICIDCWGSLYYEINGIGRRLLLYQYMNDVVCMIFIGRILQRLEYNTVLALLSYYDRRGTEFILD